MPSVSSAKQVIQVPKIEYRLHTINNNADRRDRQLQSLILATFSFDRKSLDDQKKSC